MAQHDVYPDSLIQRVMGETRTIAVVGASPNPMRPSNSVLRFLVDAGYRVFPVNPGHAGGMIAGQTVYPRLGDIPGPIDMIDIFRRSDRAGTAVDEALALSAKPKFIWMQLGVRDDAAAGRAEAAGLTVIMDRCPKIEYARLRL